MDESISAVEYSHYDTLSEDISQLSIPSHFTNDPDGFYDHTYTPPEELAAKAMELCHKCISNDILAENTVILEALQYVITVSNRSYRVKDLLFSLGICTVLSNLLQLCMDNLIIIPVLLNTCFGLLRNNNQVKCRFGLLGMCTFVAKLMNQYYKFQSPEIFVSCCNIVTELSNSKETNISVNNQWISDHIRSHRRSISVANGEENQPLLRYSILIREFINNKELFHEANINNILYISLQYYYYEQYNHSVIINILNTLTSLCYHIKNAIAFHEVHIHEIIIHMIQEIDKNYINSSTSPTHHHHHQHQHHQHHHRNQTVIDNNIHKNEHNELINESQCELYKSILWLIIQVCSNIHSNNKQILTEFNIIMLIFDHLNYFIDYFNQFINYTNIQKLIEYLLWSLINICTGYNSNIQILKDLRYSVSLISKIKKFKLLKDFVKIKAKELYDMISS